MDRANDLITRFAADYFETLYFFCLKKTGDENEARELAAEVALHVCEGLRRGEPVHFSAWVWKVARNRYARWVQAKKRQEQAFSGDDLDAVADDAQVDDALLHSEDMKLLRRELAFISAEYRRVLVAYYIDFCKITDIAASLDLPVGTVKAKLFRARTKMKEGMNMAREFGALSYKPEEIHFINSGNSGWHGEPWSVITRKICKNILIAAYRTPSTAEELAMELGIALPYLEDELERLLLDRLLRQNGKKYETNIFIASAEAQGRIHEHQTSIAPALATAITALLEYRVEIAAAQGNKLYETNQPFEDMKWALLMTAIDECSWNAVPDMYKNAPAGEHIGKMGRTLRNHGGEWDLLGLEAFHGESYDFVGQHGTFSAPHEPEICFKQFKFKYKNISEKTPENLSYAQGAALVAVEAGDTSRTAPHVFDELVNFGYLEKTAGGYRTTFAVMRQADINAMYENMTAAQRTRYAELRQAAATVIREHYDFCRETLHREVPAFLKNDTHQINFAVDTIFSLRGALLAGALDSGYISYAQGDERRMLGAMLVI